MANRFVIAILETKRRIDRKAIPASILLLMPCLNVTFVSNQILCIEIYKAFASMSMAGYPVHKRLFQGAGTLAELFDIAAKKPLAFIQDGNTVAQGFDII